MTKGEGWKKAAAAGMLSIAMVFALTACGEKKENRTVSKKEAGTVSDKKGKKDTKKEEVFQTEYQEFGAEISSANGFCYYDGRIYMAGYQESEDQAGTTKYLFSCKADGSDIRQSELSMQENESYAGGNVSIDKKGCLRLLTSSYSEQDGNKCFVRMFDTDGNDSGRYELVPEEGDECYFSQPLIAGDGTVYAGGNAAIYSFGTDGKRNGKIEVDGSIYIQSMVQAEDGSIYACCYQDMDRMLRKLETETGKLGAAIDLGGLNNISRMKAGKGNKIYIDSGTNVYTVNLSDNTMQPMFTWVNIGIDSEDIRDYVMTGEDALFALTYPMGTEDAEHEIAIVEKGTSSETKEKKVLTMACTYMRGDMKKNVIKFNRTNKEYVLQVQDYEDYEDYASRLNLDIISGKVPDIICMSSLPQDVYVKKGILTDLYPLMEKDAEIKKEDFLAPVLKAVETDGKLYSMGASFSMEGVYLGGKDYVDETSGWSIDDMQELYDHMPKAGVFMMGMNREWFIEDVVACRMGDFVDWKKGEVRFDSEDFIKLLEFSKNFPDESEWDQFYGAYNNEEGKMKKLLKKGNLMLERTVVSQWSDFNEYDAVFEGAGGSVAVSYPSSDKSDSVLMSFYDPGMAITEQCSDKEGAWEFIKMFLSYDYQVGLYNGGFMNYGFPTRKDALEKQMEYAMAIEPYTDTDGTKVEPLSMGVNYYGLNIEGKPFNESQKEMLLGMIDRIGGLIERSNSVSGDICNIVKEEVKAFHAGDKTAEETAKIVQNRVKIYVSENS